MPLLLLAVFICIPLAEVWLFIEIGGVVGTLWTVALCVMTAIAGASLVRLQGRSTLVRARESVRVGRMPLDEMFGGVCILVAGVLLLVPGFFTDVVGFLLLMPPVRGVLRQYLARRIHVQTMHARADGRVVDGEWESVDEPPDNRLT